jgi:hypothetical protein
MANEVGIVKYASICGHRYVQKSQFGGVFGRDISGISVTSLAVNRELVVVAGSLVCNSCEPRVPTPPHLILCRALISSISCASHDFNTTLCLHQQSPRPCFETAHRVSHCDPWEHRLRVRLPASAAQLPRHNGRHNSDPSRRGDQDYHKWFR